MNNAEPKSTARWKTLCAPRFLLAALLLATLSLNAAAPPSQRWLLIVDTSRAMKSRGENVQRVAHVLAQSGMNGQMRRGDTLGVWTFNDGIYSGRFPLQEWAPEFSGKIAVRVAEFLQGQQYEKASRLDKVLPAINRLAENSEFITVVLIGDGGKISGTPFDDKINGLYQSWEVEQRKREMPIVTLLRGQKGKLTDFSVGAPPWPMDFPPLPAELTRVEPKETKPAEPPRATLPPLILSGKKPEPEPAPEKSTPVAEPAKTEPAPVEKPAPAPAVARIETSAPPVETPKPAPAVPAVVSEPASNPPKVLSPPPAIVTVPTTPASPRWRLLVAAAVGGVVVLVLVIRLVMRRSRSSEPVSLITRSLDREKE